ncbi:hypothetical protein CQW23_22397 [Capsicum baccatum]|uniref:Uncharacterized protein n=1 Tax=Capsicum baccatum TaxID=33114 RepID=A0A2G2W0R7_CAPBA|nr:hypothetical protein CQW23_22397 [Capsicum baccatum]
MVDYWWGIVEVAPRQYNWRGYRKLFDMIRGLNLKCNDKYLLKSLKIVAEEAGCSTWARVAKNAGFDQSRYKVLGLAKSIFRGTPIAEKLSGIHWDYPKALADLEGLVWQVLNVGWAIEIAVAGENVLPCYDRKGYSKILEVAKPVGSPKHRQIYRLTYLRLCSTLPDHDNLMEFTSFVQKRHGVKPSG